MNIEPLNERVVQLWNDPDPMIKDWDVQPHKVRIEQLVAYWVGFVGPVADLGCGPGRLVDALHIPQGQYFGFDGSTAMIDRAKAMHPECSFAVADMFQYSSDRKYEVVVLLDVAPHQSDPLESVLQVMKLWDAKRYVFTILVGAMHEELYMSVVVALDELMDVLERVRLHRMYMERVGDEKFAWMLLDVGR